MEGGEGEQSLADLANAVGISRQLLHQQFRNHVLKGPSEFRKIVRFRQALALWSGQQREKLTEISTFVNYFDQSHMIRDFKSVTGYTPKRFFSGLSTFGNGTINWFFSAGVVACPVSVFSIPPDIVKKGFAGILSDWRHKS